jgi:hypothetical protein
MSVSTPIGRKKSAKRATGEMEIFPFGHQNFLIGHLVVIASQMKQSVHHYAAKLPLK